jgi:glutathione S-transferase
MKSAWADRRKSTLGSLADTSWKTAPPGAGATDNFRPPGSDILLMTASLTVSSKNYSSWCLRGWLLCRIAGLEFVEKAIPIDDPSTRAELLLLSPSFLVPCLEHDGVAVWDVVAIAEYLNELRPEAGLLPQDRAARALCRAICGEMHSGFSNLRSALPMNLKARYPGFNVWPGAQATLSALRQSGASASRLIRPYPFGQ